MIQVSNVSLKFGKRTLFEDVNIKCEKCGKLIHLHCEEVKKFIDHISSAHDFLMNPARTVFYGICSECREADNGDN